MYEFLTPQNQVMWIFFDKFHVSANLFFQGKDQDRNNTKKNLLLFFGKKTLDEKKERNQL